MTRIRVISVGTLLHCWKWDIRGPHWRQESLGKQRVVKPGGRRSGMAHVLGAAYAYEPEYRWLSMSEDRAMIAEQLGVAESCVNAPLTKWGFQGRVRFHEILRPSQLLDLAIKERRLRKVAELRSAY